MFTRLPVAETRAPSPDSGIFGRKMQGRAGPSLKFSLAHNRLGYPALVLLTRSACLVRSPADPTRQSGEAVGQSEKRTKLSRAAFCACTLSCQPDHPRCIIRQIAPSHFDVPPRYALIAGRARPADVRVQARKLYSSALSGWRRSPRSQTALGQTLAGQGERLGRGGSTTSFEKVQRIMARRQPSP